LLLVLVLKLVVFVFITTVDKAKCSIHFGHSLNGIFLRQQRTHANIAEDATCRLMALTWLCLHSLTGSLDLGRCTLQTSWSLAVSQPASTLSLTSTFSLQIYHLCWGRLCWH